MRGLFCITVFFSFWYWHLNIQIYILFELCRRSYTFLIDLDSYTILTFTHSNESIHSHTVVSLRQVVFSWTGVVGIDSVSGLHVCSITGPFCQPLVGVDVGEMDANNDDKCHNQCNNSEMVEVGTNQTEWYLKQKRHSNVKKRLLYLQCGCIHCERIQWIIIYLYKLQNGIFRTKEHISYVYKCHICYDSTTVKALCNYG